MALLAQLTDAEIRYLGGLADQVLSPVYSVARRMAAWQQLIGLFRTKFEGISYRLIREVLLSCPGTQHLYASGDELVGRLLRKEQEDGELVQWIEACEMREHQRELQRQSERELLQREMQMSTSGLPREMSTSGLPREQLPRYDSRPAGPRPTATDEEPLGLDRFCVRPTVSGLPGDDFLRERSLEPQEIEYFCQLDDAERARFASMHAELSCESSKPTRFRVLDSRLPGDVKADVLRKLDAAVRPGPAGGMVSCVDAKYQQWVDHALQLPLGRFRPLPVDPTDPAAVAGLLDEMRRCLDQHVMGQARAKEALVEVVAACVSNPEYAGGSVLGLCGEPGVGKTSLIRKGLALALDRPCIYVSLAGAGDAGHVGGFSFTFEGSRPGALAQGAIRAGCLNPVFLLDEADKCTHKGIADLLCSATDSSNQGFVDKYFQDIELDLSKAMFVFCYNDADAIDPVLRDRITEIRMDTFSPAEQVTIAERFIAPSLKSQLLIDSVELDSATMTHLVREYTPNRTGGVRPVLKPLQRLLMRLNILLKSRSAAQVGGGPEARALISSLDDGPTRVTARLVDELLESTFDPGAFRVSETTMFM